MANKQLPPADAACAICTRRQVELHKQTNDKPKPCPADSAPIVEYLVCNNINNALCLKDPDDSYKVLVAQPMSKKGDIDVTHILVFYLSKLMYYKYIFIYI